MTLYDGDERMYMASRWQPGTDLGRSWIELELGQRMVNIHVIYPLESRIVSSWCSGNGTMYATSPYVAAGMKSVNCYKHRRKTIYQN
jgi:hypothetical protein